jgi:hypothetical protein
MQPKLSIAILILFVLAHPMFGVDRAAGLPAIAAASSSCLEPGWDPELVIDGWFKAPWFSSAPASAERPEWILIALAQPAEISHIFLFPRYTGIRRQIPAAFRVMDF